MTRCECEVQIGELLKKAVELYHQYNPEGRFLFMGYDTNGEKGNITVYNRFWVGGPDEGHAICIDIPLEVQK